MSLQFNSKVAKEAQPVRRDYLQAGIHNNCSLVESGIKQTVNGVSYVSFTFQQDETNAIAELKVWFPKPETVTPRDGETVEQAQQRDINNALTQVIHVIETVTNEEIPTITAATFEDWANAALTRLTNKKKNKVKVKQIYDKNGMYATFPNRIPFVELQEVEPTRLKFTKFEIENRLKKAEAPNETIKSSNNTEDLPF